MYAVEALPDGLAGKKELTPMLELYEQIKEQVVAAEEDVRKAAGGNRAAGTRVRKTMQDLKNLAQAMRVKVLENRDGDS